MEDEKYYYNEEIYDSIPDGLVPLNNQDFFHTQNSTLLPEVTVLGKRPKPLNGFRQWWETFVLGTPEYNIEDYNDLKYAIMQAYRDGYEGKNIIWDNRLYKAILNDEDKKYYDYIQSKYNIQNGVIQDTTVDGNPIKHTYIGGKNNDETRNKFWDQNPRIEYVADSIGNKYGLNPGMVRQALNREGYVDQTINKINSNPDNVLDYTYLHSPLRAIDNNGNPVSVGFSSFGTDEGADYINNGQAKLIGNETWSDSDNTNEHGRSVRTADGLTPPDNMGIVAALLKMFRDKAKKDFPGKSEDFYDKAAQEYYNRGFTGGKNYMKSHKFGGKLIPKKRYMK